MIRNGTDFTKATSLEDPRLEDFDQAKEAKDEAKEITKENTKARVKIRNSKKVDWNLRNFLRKH